MSNGRDSTNSVARPQLQLDSYEPAALRQASCAIKWVLYAQMLRKSDEFLRTSLGLPH